MHYKTFLASLMKQYFTLKTVQFGGIPYTKPRKKIHQSILIVYVHHVNQLALY